MKFVHFYWLIILLLFYFFKEINLNNDITSTDFDRFENYMLNNDTAFLAEAEYNALQAGIIVGACLAVAVPVGMFIIIHFCFVLNS